MSYYKDKKEALKRVTEMLAESKTEKEIIRAMGYAFGYGELTVRRMIKQVTIT